MIEVATDEEWRSQLWKYIIIVLVGIFLPPIFWLVGLIYAIIKLVEHIQNRSTL